MSERVTQAQVDRTLLRSTVIDLLHTCGIQPAGIISNEEDLLAVKRYVQGLQRTVEELRRPPSPLLVDE